ncbi:ankyrin repeat domain-containing protein [Candidatus Babeliales bacterium]|nr:ankyrin repeat domain-containing protein [Candidatus Babeliales bacterium]
MSKQIIFCFLLALVGSDGQVWGAATVELNAAIPQTARERFNAMLATQKADVQAKKVDLINIINNFITGDNITKTTSLELYDAINAAIADEIAAKQFLVVPFINTIMKFKYNEPWANQEKKIKAATSALINAGVDLRGKFGAETVLTIATTKDKLELVKKIVEQFDENYRTISKPSGTDLVSSRKFEINRQNDGGRTALHIAASNKKLDIVNYLLEQGADPNIEDKQGKTLLHMLLNNPTTEVLPIIDAVLTKNPDVNKPTTDNQTPLITLARSTAGSTSPEIVKQYFEKLWNHAQAQLTALDLNAQNDDGNTALHEFITLYVGFLHHNPDADLSFFKELLEKGADPLIQNNDMTLPRSPLINALTYSPLVANIMIEHLLKINPAGLEAEVTRLKTNHFAGPLGNDLETAIKEVKEKPLKNLQQTLEALKAKLVTLAQELATLATK